MAAKQQLQYTKAFIIIIYVLPVRLRVSMKTARQFLSSQDLLNPEDTAARAGIPYMFAKGTKKWTSAMYITDQVTALTK